MMRTCRLLSQLPVVECWGGGGWERAHLQRMIHYLCVRTILVKKYIFVIYEPRF